MVYTSPSFSSPASTVLLLLLAAIGAHGVFPDGGPLQDQSGRIIPPFSPSLELARSLGSSPVTPRGRGDAPTLQHPPRASTVDVDDHMRFEGSEGYTTYGKGLEDVPPLDLEDDRTDCPPVLPEDYIAWRRNSKTVRATLPHMVPKSCQPPLKCSVSTTVHRLVFLQDGDSLEVILQAPPDYTPPTPSTTTTTTTPPPTTTTIATTTTTTTTTTSTTTTTTTRTPTTTTKRVPTEGLTDPTKTSPTTQQQQQETQQQQQETQQQQQDTQQQSEEEEAKEDVEQVTGVSKDSKRPVETTQPISPAPSQPPHQTDQQLEPPKPSQHQDIHGTERPPHPEPLVNNRTHLFSREDNHPTEPPAGARSKRQVVGGAPHYPRYLQSTSLPQDAFDERKPENQTANSPLTLWKVSVAEWSSCSTREGGQIGEGGDNGVVTVEPRYLQAGTNYFIGRSSWSSTECFKLQVTIRSAECGEGSLCSAKGSCFANSSMEHFQCRCCEGYKGTHCEELDACASDPCLNNGMCVDIQEGHDGDTFQCLCLYGYRGRYCEERISLCESQPCQNGGTCTGNHSSYTCLCRPGWTGTQCGEQMASVDLARPYEDPGALTTCSADACAQGVCVETQTQGYKCFCQPGYGGSRCEFEYNECESNPCVNGGTCVDIVNGFQCLCGRGYMGQLCQIKVDLCSPNPCPVNKVCVDKGNSYGCECLSGLTEDDCGPHSQVCTPNPCENGGSCWIVPEVHVFFCSCRAGFTGRTCQGIAPNIHDEAVLETVGAVGTVEPGPLDVRLAMDGGPFSHMRNIYVAFATLAAALLIFILVVGVCHCRVNRTYRKCFVKIPRPSKVLPTVRRPRPTSLFDKARRDRNGAMRLEIDPDGAAMPMTSCNANSDAVYYNMDNSDNQELPLIK